MSEFVFASIEPEDALSGRYTIIDVRAPVEYADGSLPGSVNLPLLDDTMRDQVGTVYHQAGPKAARLAAMDLVSPGLPGYLRSLVNSLLPGTRPAILCKRGGERSRNVVLLLALIGVQAVQIRGGYRGYRRWVREALQQWKPWLPVVTLYGHTGSGKSALLRELERVADEPAGRGGGTSPRPWAVDLEELALHRGSLLGGLNQPAARGQRDFEALLWERLRLAQGDYLVLEGEGRRIGRISLPASVADTVRNGLPVSVAAPLEERTARILREYRPEGWSEAEKEDFLASLTLIGERLGAKWVASLRRAFEDGRFAAVVRGLLVDYYDPLYQKSSVEGRDFVLEFTTSPDSLADARRLTVDIARILARQGSNKA